MGSDDEAMLPLLESREVVERAHLLCVIREIEQQHVPALNRPLDARDENDPALGRIRSQMTDIELLLVKGDGKRAISKRCSSIDQLGTGVRDSIHGVVSGMGMELDFQHRQSILDRLWTCLNG